MGTMKRSVLAIFLSSSLMVNPSWGTVATEQTQIANRVLIAELVRKGAEELRNWAANLGINFQQLAVITEKLGTIIIIKQQLDQLRQLLSPDQILAMLTNELGVTSIDEFLNMANDVQAMLDSIRGLQLDFNVILREAAISQGVVDRLREEGYDVNPDDYFTTLRQFAELQDREAIRRMEFYNEAIVSAQRNMKQIREQSEKIAKYEGLTEAMQAVATAMIDLSASLKQIQMLSAAQGTEEVRIAQALTKMAENEALQEEAGRRMFLSGMGFGEAIAEQNLQNPDNGQ